MLDNCGHLPHAEKVDEFVDFVCRNEYRLFHLMPYADLDLEAGRKNGTVWVKLPNKHFDPEKGHKLYNRYLDELEYGEQLGFDAVSVNEHHQTAYGLMPSPIVTASALARRTKRVKIAILGSALPLRSHPLTVAEEHAMIDVISGGRLISGFVRGIGAEYHTFGVNPTFSHDRFHEAHDLIVRAWTEPGPFAFQGKHYNVQYVNLWPRPYQKPHPPIWIPSQGSKETIDWASHPDRRYTYLQTFSPVEGGGALPEDVPRHLRRATATRRRIHSSAGPFPSMSAATTKAPGGKQRSISKISATSSCACRSRCCCRRATPRASR